VKYSYPIPKEYTFFFLKNNSHVIFPPWELWFRIFIDQTLSDEQFENRLVLSTTSPPPPEAAPLPKLGDDEESLGDIELGENSHTKSDAAVGATTTTTVVEGTAMEYPIDMFDLADENNGVVRLPSNGVNGNRTVPAACVICLCPYEAGEQVSWSPKSNCKHAFHTDCIIPWLAKTDEPKCPVCRQEFCTAAVIDDDLYEDEASFLESFSRALAISQFYRASATAADERNNNNNNHNNDSSHNHMNLNRSSRLVGDGPETPSNYVFPGYPLQARVVLSSSSSALSTSEHPAHRTGGGADPEPVDTSTEAAGNNDHPGQSNDENNQQPGR
jgi:hypothetical protein